MASAVKRLCAGGGAVWRNGIRVPQPLHHSRNHHRIRRSHNHNPRSSRHWAGNTVDGVGDVNGDGFADILLSAPAKSLFRVCAPSTNIFPTKRFAPQSTKASPRIPSRVPCLFPSLQRGLLPATLIDTAGQLSKLATTTISWQEPEKVCVKKTLLALCVCVCRLNFVLLVCPLFRMLRGGVCVRQRNDVATSLPLQADGAHRARGACAQ